MKPNCIDISTWQQNVDFNKVKASGVTAVIIRAGFSTVKDNQFENHYKGARAAGLNIGAYWYSYAYDTYESAQEAKACAKILKGKSFELPVYYDMEEAGQMSLGMNTLTDVACSFLETLKAGGFRVGIYSSPSWFTSCLNYELLKSKYSVWLAHWSSSHSCACDIWQYGVGRVNGVSGDCDCNIIENLAVVSGSCVGNKDEYCAVKDVQRLLNSQFSAGLDVDGIYGSRTRKALVRALQTELNNNGANLAVDGIYGACTGLAVNNLAAGAKGDLVKILQAMLICKGYNIILDGIFGNQTDAAVRAFQSANGLYVDGVAGRATFGTLVS